MARNTIGFTASRFVSLDIAAYRPTAENLEYHAYEIFR